MFSPIEELKIQAKKRLKQTPASTELLKLSKGEKPKLKHCQLLIARQYGFMHWDHARLILSEKASDDANNDLHNDYGSFWYNNRCGTLLNHWCTTHAEAREVQKANGGTILPYKNQFMVVDKQFLTFVGLDYDDPLWLDVGHDWCRGQIEARLALALKRIRHQ